MEILDVYTAQKERTEQTHVRDTPLPADEYRFVVTVVLFNSRNQTLIQQRQATKYSWPLYWDFAASGGVESGESCYQAAERELWEELGVKVDLKDVPSRMTLRFEEGWDEIYFVQQDIELSQLKLQEEEVAAVKWVTEAELLALLEAGEFIPYIHTKTIFDYHYSSSEHFKKPIR